MALAAAWRYREAPWSRNQRPASQTEEGEKLLRATVLYTSASCTKRYVVLQSFAKCQVHTVTTYYRGWRGHLGILLGVKMHFAGVDI